VPSAIVTLMSALAETLPRDSLAPAVVPLENGDCLGAEEFLRRYEAMPDVKKAELIEGIVYVGSTVRAVQHGLPDSLIQTWLGYYAAFTPGVETATNTTIVFDGDTVPQPDALLRVLPECGGRTELTPDGYLSGPPELIVEIAATSASRDLRVKLRAYRRNGVREYLVWRTVDEAFDWFVLEHDEYVLNQPDAQNVLHSRLFPGLALNLPALLARNAAAVLATLEQALRAPEHAKFTARLAAQRK
jgi:Uma2 family endonuclease